MSSLKDRVKKIRSLEAEKLSLLAEIEDLKRMADAKANALVDDIASLREDIKSLKVLMGAEKLQEPPPDVMKEQKVEAEKPQEPPPDVMKEQKVEAEKPQEPSPDLIKEQNVIAVRELVEKTLDASNNLGNQVFAVSPFSQCFDDWLFNMRRIVSEFESSSVIKVDEQFVRDRLHLLQDVECALALKKLEESKMGEVAKSLADANHLLVVTDEEYAEKSTALNLKKDLETGPLLTRVRGLMSDVKILEDTKNKIFKKKTADKLAQTKKDLQSAENELEAVQSKFNAEQDKLHEKYEKKKQELTGQLESLHKELERLETDTSIEARQAASNALANAVNALVQRTSLNA